MRAVQAEARRVAERVAVCGIFGVVGVRCAGEVVEAAVERMAHRGPDDRGVVCFDLGVGGEVWLGLRRLAVLDPSPRGRQPMGDEAGEVWIVFNGEIYNFRALRRELEGRGCRFRSETDTEVLLHAYRAWGVGALGRLVGMFAFGIWDGRRRELVLVRDRLGVKPLYYHCEGGRLAFASEVKALLALPWVRREVNPVALARYLAFLWVPAPDTLLRGVRQLEPGTYARFRDGRLTVERYWDLPLGPPGAGGGSAREGNGFPCGADRSWAPARSEDGVVQAVKDLLAQAVRERLVSDVPLGAFLSGGVDSSLVVALMREAGVSSPLAEAAVFPVEDERYHIEVPDAPYARRVRDWLGGLDYHEVVLDARVVELLPRLVWHLDDPVGDPAALATYLLCRAAKARATVMLSGMGAEELFAGYPRHLAVLLAERYRRLPGVLRRRVVRPLVERLPAGRPWPLLRLARNAKKFVRSADAGFEARYLGYLSYYGEAEVAALLDGEVAQAAEAAGEPLWGVHSRFLEETVGRDPVFRMTHLDLKTFLPGLNLAYTDRASMAASVEVRVPFLDHRLVEYVVGLPWWLKIRGRVQKYVLKRVAERYLPRAVVHRPKAGFGAPVRAWVVRDLRELIGDVLSPERLRRRGLLRPAAVWAVIEDQWSGREDNALRIWALLTLELWAETFLDRDGSGWVG